MSAPPFSASGRLVLSWVGKDGTPINTSGGGHEWVGPDDPRVVQVRTLDEGDLYRDIPTDNLLIQGDSLDALSWLNRIPEDAARYRGQVKLAYIDPPFNTGRACAPYDDSLEPSIWLTMMRDRSSRSATSSRPMDGCGCISTTPKWPAAA